jgi:hypothetical protein
MAPRPVHELTAQEAVLELEQLCDHPPEHSKDKPAWAARKSDLEIRIITLQGTAPAAPSPAPAPKSRRRHSASPDPIASKLQLLQELVSLDDDDSRRRADRLRFDIRKTCEWLERPVPPEAALKQPHRKASPAVSQSAAIAQEALLPFSPAGARFEMAPLQVFAPQLPSAQIKDITRNVAGLLPALLELPPEAREELVKPLANLDALVHLAARYAAEGVIEVAG